MALSTQATSRYAQFLGGVVINTVVAVLGAGILETSFGAAVHPHSISQLLWKAVGMSVFCGLLLGGLIYKMFRSSTAKLAWVLPALWFALRIFLFLGTGFNLGRIWQQMSGTACMSALAARGCETSFFVFTIPLIRGAAYAGGSQVAAWFLRIYWLD